MPIGELMYCKTVSWQGPPDILTGVSGRQADRRSLPTANSPKEVRAVDHIT